MKQLQLLKFFLPLAFTFLTTKASTQQNPCETKEFKNSFVQPDRNPNRYARPERTTPENDLPLPLYQEMKKSIASHYSQAFADSCEFKHLIYFKQTDQIGSAYELVFMLSLPDKIKYRLEFDFNNDGSENYFGFPVIPDSVLFKKDISCNKAVLAAKKDKLYPFSKVETLGLTHIISDLEGEPNGFFWFVGGPISKGNKAGFVTQRFKLIEFSSFKVINRNTRSKQAKGIVRDESIQKPE